MRPRFPPIAASHRDTAYVRNHAVTASAVKPMKNAVIAPYAWWQSVPLTTARAPCATDCVMRCSFVSNARTIQGCSPTSWSVVEKGRSTRN